MVFASFTRPDGSPVSLNAAEILSLAPVPPPDSPVAGPLSEGTRITFKNGRHQDVKERVAEVEATLNAAG